LMRPSGGQEEHLVAAQHEAGHAHAWVREAGETAVRTRISPFECFPYVCPEPVLVK
jgi:hypothetical protein